MKRKLLDQFPPSVSNEGIVDSLKALKLRVFNDEDSLINSANTDTLVSSFGNVDKLQKKLQTINYIDYSKVIIKSETHLKVPLLEAGVFFTTNIPKLKSAIDWLLDDLKTELSTVINSNVKTTPSPITVNRKKYISVINDVSKKYADIISSSPVTSVELSKVIERFVDIKPLVKQCYGLELIDKQSKNSELLSKITDIITLLDFNKNYSVKSTLDPLASGITTYSTMIYNSRLLILTSVSLIKTLDKITVE